MPGAKLYAKTTSLASLLDNMDDTMGDQDTVAVKRLSPISHACSSMSHDSL
jgi:hypothetical protein